MSHGFIASGTSSLNDDAELDEVDNSKSEGLMPVPTEWNARGTLLPAKGSKGSSSSSSIGSVEDLSEEFGVIDRGNKD